MAFSIRIACLCGLLLTGLLALATSAQDTARPGPDLSPEDVVRIQLQALRSNDPDNDQGIAIAYRFATPSNKQAIGNLAAFARMMHEGFTDMLAHESAHIELARRSRSEAVVQATLTLATGSQNRYLFVLRRLDGAPCAGCWLTDGVIPAKDNTAPLHSI